MTQQTAHTRKWCGYSISTTQCH